MSKWNRSKFYKSELVDGKQEQDLVYNYWDLFEIRRPLRYYSIESTDLLRPDILSVKFYGRQNFWWIVMKVNNIIDIWYDLEVGKILKVPDINDIQEFYMAVKEKKRSEEN